MQNQQCIATIIEKELVEPHFQGIIDLHTKDYFAFESLIRSTPAILPLAPDQLFAMAESQGYLLEFDRFCVLSAIKCFMRQKLSGLLFVNILPVNLGRILPFLPINKSHSALKGIVFEISEKHPLHNLCELKEYIKILRQHGALIAIDDLGAGHSGLISWAELTPEFVKIDRHFINSIHIDAVKREFTHSIIEIALGLRCKVIAEGIEASEELDILNAIGINLGQGYLLHRPEAEPSHQFANNQCFPLISKVQHVAHTRHAETVGSMIQYIVPIDASLSAAEVNNLFKHNPGLQSLPVVQQDKPIGIISRNKIGELFSDRYSYPLYGKKTITEFMDVKPIIVGHEESLHSVSEKITGDVSNNLNIDFIITKDKRYCGVGKVSTLLKILTDAQIQRARHSNPLTLLPGNVLIYNHVESLISQQQDFHLAYFDINHFKPFNDYFGYNAGDEVIKLLSAILLEHSAPVFDMVGHIGGDDFIVVYRSNDWQRKCEFILEHFKAMTLKFYSKEEVLQQGVWCKDRRGDKGFFSLLSLAIGVVNPETSISMTYHEITELATNAKKQAKLKAGNHLFISRRRSHYMKTGSTPAIK